MQHKACFEAVNRTLNDVCNRGNQQLFGGISTVLGGDFAQILPVIRRGTRQSTCVGLNSTLLSLAAFAYLETQNQYAYDGQ